MRIQRRTHDQVSWYVEVDPAGNVLRAARDLQTICRKGGGTIEASIVSALNGAQRLVPCEPSKIVCVGLNYRKHAAEMGKALPAEPLLFLKPPSALIGPGQPILLPAASHEVHYEAELAVVIGIRATDVRVEDALDHVLGYTLINDVTARDLQRSDVQYTRAKSFDTFAPLGPTIVTELDPESLEISLNVNGEQRQRSLCSDMIFSVPEIVSFVSGVMTLEPGDVIATGTPAGVGPLREGDLVSLAISVLYGAIAG